ncbi:MAG: hypothetical protein U0232_28960 [Thermomicrobiales bacterium]
MAAADVEHDVVGEAGRFVVGEVADVVFVDQRPAELVAQGAGEGGFAAAGRAFGRGGRGWGGASVGSSDE